MAEFLFENLWMKENESVCRAALAMSLRFFLRITDQTRKVQSQVHGRVSEIGSARVYSHGSTLMAWLQDPSEVLMKHPF